MLTKKFKERVFDLEVRTNVMCSVVISKLKALDAVEDLGLVEKVLSGEQVYSQDIKFDDPSRSDFMEMLGWFFRAMRALNDFNTLDFEYSYRNWKGEAMRIGVNASSLVEEEIKRMKNEEN